MSEDTTRGALYIEATSDRTHQIEQRPEYYTAATTGVGHLSEVFTDLGGSHRRPALNAAFAAAQAGRFDVLLMHRAHELTSASRLRQMAERFQAAAVPVSLAERFESTSWSAAAWMNVIDAENSDELGELIHQLTAAEVILCTATRPQKSRSDLGIGAVDEALGVGVHRELAGPLRWARALAVGPAPAGDAR